MKTFNLGYTDFFGRISDQEVIAACKRLLAAIDDWSEFAEEMNLTGNPWCKRGHHFKAARLYLNKVLGVKRFIFQGTRDEYIIIEDLARGCDPRELELFKVEENAILVSLGDTFWRMLKKIAPDGLFECGGYKVEVPTGMLEEVSNSGTYKVLFKRKTLSILPASSEPTHSGPEAVLWIQGLTCWCDGYLNRMMED